MKTTQAFATKLSPQIIRALSRVCGLYGLRKNHVVEEAIREKIEDIVDTFDLDEARKTATSFVPWETVERELKRKGKL